jgi:hypothetical protein
VGDAGALLAQNPLRASFGGFGAATRVETEEPAVTQLLTGFLLGGVASAALGRFSIDGRYAEGSVESSNGSFAQDVVEAEVLIGAAPLPWLLVKAGPHVRSFTFADGTRRRWVFWEARLRAQARMLDRVLLGYLEGWKVVGGSVSGSDPFDAAQGAEGGLEFRFESLPVWTRIGYRVDRSRLQGIADPQTVEQIIFAVGVRK